DPVRGHNMAPALATNAPDRLSAKRLVPPPAATTNASIPTSPTSGGVASKSTAGPVARIASGQLPVARTNHASSISPGDPKAFPMPPSRPRIGRAAMFAAGAVLLAGVIGLISLAGSGGIGTVQLSRAGHPLEVFSIGSADEVLILGALPRVDHLSEAA